MQITIEVTPEGQVMVMADGAEPMPVQSMQELTDMLGGMIPELAASPDESAMWNEEVAASQAPAMDEMDQASITA